MLALAHFTLSVDITAGTATRYGISRASANYTYMCTRISTESSYSGTSDLEALFAAIW
jgi:hypothetical protein